MAPSTLVALLLPLASTTLGSAFMFFLKRTWADRSKKPTAFAAGAVMHVVVEELVPETRTGRHTNIGTIAVAIGFALMMILAAALG